MSLLPRVRLIHLSFILVACSGSNGVDDELLAVADSSSDIDSDLSKLTALFVTEPVGVATTLPFGCALASADQANTPNDGQVHYSFTSCALPGIGPVGGAVNVVYTVTGPTLHLDVQASGLDVDRASMSSWSASADVTASGSDRNMVWQSQASGTAQVRQTPRTFTVNGSATLKWSAGSTCLDVDGQANNTFQASDGSPLSFATALSSFVACGSVCPESGSEVRADLQSGNYVRLQYGQNIYTNEKGQTFGFVPACASQ